jgi:hypothetical protein
MPHASQLSFLGIAKEVTPGTGVPATAYIPVSAPTSKDALTMLPDKGLRGAMVDEYDEIAGVKSGTVDFGGDVFPDTVPWVIAGILGDVVTTGASAPYTHVISTLNTSDGQPKSYSLTDYYSTGTRQYPGAKFSDFGLKFSADGMLTYTAKAVTYPSATVTKPTSSFTAVPPLAGWVGAVTIGGASTVVVLDGEINLKRTVTVIDAVDGTQAPAALWSGPVSADGKMTVVMDDDAELLRFLNNTATTLSVNYQQGSGSSAVQVKFDLSKVKYSAAEIGRSKDYVELAITFKGLANVTDIGASGGYSPVKATIQNAVTTGTYA